MEKWYKLRNVKKEREYTSNSASRIFNFIAATFTIIGVILYFVSEDTKKFITDLSPYLLLMTLVLIIYLLIFQGKLEDIISEKNKELKTETKGLWNYYGELSKYENDNKINGLLNAFVDSNEFVCGLQMYTYKVFSSRMAFPYLALTKEEKQKSITNIKLNYKNGYVREGEDLNAIAQSYYTIESDLLHKFSNKAKLALIQKEPSELTAFLIEHFKILQKKDIDDLDDNDAMLFALIELGLSFLEWRYSLVFDKPLLEEEKVKLLKKKKRTGIANAIINFHNISGQSWFSFVYKGSGDGKSARKYISYIIENAIGEKLLFLISVNTQEEWDSYEEINIHNEIRDNLIKALGNSEILFNEKS